MLSVQTRAINKSIQSQTKNLRMHPINLKIMIFWYFVKSKQKRIWKISIVMLFLKEGTMHNLLMKDTHIWDERDNDWNKDIALFKYL